MAPSLVEALALRSLTAAVGVTQADHIAGELEKFADAEGLRWDEAACVRDAADLIRSAASAHVAGVVVPLAA